MSEVELIKMSSKGQVVIPQSFRDELELKEGTSIAVAASGDTLLLKKVAVPSKKDILNRMDRLVKTGNARAKKLGINEKDVSKLIHRGRGIKDD